MKITSVTDERKILTTLLCLVCYTSTDQNIFSL